MSVAFVQVGASHSSTLVSTPITIVFGSNSTAGDTIVVGATVHPNSGSVTSISVTDNNGNVYKAATNLVSPKSSSCQAFIASNISVSPNNPLTITISPVSSAGAGATWTYGVIAEEFSGVTSSSFSGAASSSGGTVSVTGIAAGSSAAGLTLSGNSGSGSGTISGPPTWTFELADNGGTVATRTAASYSVGVAAGTQTYADTVAASGGAVAIVVFNFPYSVPDCRNYGHFPNSSRNVNGTSIYDVQTSSNSAVPGTDSRTAGAPVASGTYPQNSRTPGTYGPGE